LQAADADHAGGSWSAARTVRGSDLDALDELFGPVAELVDHGLTDCTVDLSLSTAF